MIGIVGGAGPFAGVELMKRIITETEATLDQEHLPVLLWSVPEDIPDRTEFLEGRVAENPANAISRVFRKLEKSGATVAAIACNTAHAPAIFNEVKRILCEEHSRIRIVNIVDETVKYIESKYPEGSPIGILSTTGVWKEKIYRKPLEKSGFRILDSRDIAGQEKIHQAIYDREYGIKAHSSPVTSRARKILLDAAGHLIDEGAEAIVLGCTEIPLAITEKTIRGVPVVDTLSILARSLIRSFSPGKLKQEGDE